MPTRQKKMLLLRAQVETQIRFTLKSGAVLQSFHSQVQGHRPTGLDSMGGKWDMRLIRVVLALAGALQCASVRLKDPTCNATLHTDMSIGGNAFKEFKAGTAECCAACVADPMCAAFVISTASNTCFLKADLTGPHAKTDNDCGVVRGVFPPVPPPPGPPAPPPPSPPLPPGSPQWVLMNATAQPVIGPGHPDVLSHNIKNGFETGQFFELNGTFYYTANELGTCENGGVIWDLVTRAALWSAPASSGPWSRVLTLRNGSHMETVCKPATAPCAVPCGASCCSGTRENPSFVTWAPTLIHAPSSVNATGKNVWNLFYSSNQNSHMGDEAFNGITWAVSTTDSMLGPYVDVPGVNGSALPRGAEGVVNIVVNSSHSFSAWKLRNGSWAGFKNNIPGATSFSAGLIVPLGDPTIPGGSWRPAGPNLASGSNCSAGLCYSPENPVVALSNDGKFYLAVYDALSASGDDIGTAFSADGVTWQHSALLTVQTGGNHPCGHIRTPLGLVPEPDRCSGCYSVLWTGAQGNFRPVCHAIIRNINE